MTYINYRCEHWIFSTHIESIQGRKRWRANVEIENNVIFFVSNLHRRKMLFPPSVPQAHHMIKKHTHNSCLCSQGYRSISLLNGQSLQFPQHCHWTRLFFRYMCIFSQYYPEKQRQVGFNSLILNVFDSLNRRYRPAADVGCSMRKNRMLHRGLIAFSNDVWHKCLLLSF